jgi:hypothetical protein
MISGDKNPNAFLSVNDYEYIDKLQKIDTSLNKLIDEIISAQSGDINLATRLTAILSAAVLKTGLIQDLPAGGFKITGLADATNATDAVNRQTAIAIASGGGSPAEIAVTDLGVGTADSLQLIRVAAAGDYLEGYTFSDSWNAPKTNDFNAVANKKELVDVTSGNIVATLLASPTIGAYHKFAVYGNDLNILTIARNGCDIYYAGELIDEQGDGNLILGNGDSVELVCFQSNKYMVV